MTDKGKPPPIILKPALLEQSSCLSTLQARAEKAEHYMDKFAAESNELRTLLVKVSEALEKIAREDYRGPRPRSVDIARAALNDLDAVARLKREGAENETLREALKDTIHAIEVGDLGSEEFVTGILSRARAALNDLDAKKP